jgi:hypothetical protein
MRYHRTANPESFWFDDYEEYIEESTLNKSSFHN